MFHLRLLEDLLLQSDHWRDICARSSSDRGDLCGRGPEAVLFDTRHLPVKEGRITTGKILKWRTSTGVHLFDDERNGAIVQQFEDGSRPLTLACSVSLLGKYMISSMATFLIRPEQPCIDPGGEDAAREVDLLNGFVKVIDVL